MSMIFRWPASCLLRRVVSKPITSLRANYTTSAEISISIEKREKMSLSRKEHKISTLNPALITPADFLDLSHRASIAIRFPQSAGANGSSQLHYYRDQKVQPVEAHPFPSHSQGFFYYRSAPRGTPLEGSLRFRVTEDNDPASFPFGRDLLMSEDGWGFPWQVILPQVACSAHYAHISKQLLHERLVTAGQLERCRSLFDERRLFPALTLFHLDSVFPVLFSGRLNLNVVGKDAVYRVKMSALFAERVNGSRQRWLWSGAALVHFEPSADPVYAGRRVLHLRIAKIVRPAVCMVENFEGRISQPQEGELFTVRNPDDEDPQPWAYDIDERTGTVAEGLRALWDNSGPDV